ncbi:MAG TPA: LysR family transcriptional regulator [Burkholderiales bacterium]|jgi:DNA-binding transcriptional LysR family regulator
MNFADLQVFKTVVEEGGIVRAARRLHRVPSNVTTRIKHLEETVGMPLFHRDRQRLHLSPSGELLLGYADRLIRLSEEARHVVSGAAPQGALKLGALESTTASRLPALLAEYHRRFPEVRLELTTGTNDALLKAVAERRIDAAFIAESPPEQSLAFMPVFRERLTLISSPEHAPIKHARDVQDETLIAFPEGCGYRRVLQRWLGKQSLAAARVMDLGSYHAIVAMAAAGAGVALVPEAVLDTMPHAQVQRHPIPRAYSEIVTPLVWRAGEVSPPVLALRELVGATLKTAKARAKAA